MPFYLSRGAVAGLLGVLLCLLVACTAAQTPAQSPAHSVYLIGNTARTPLTETRLAAVRQTLRQTGHPFTLVHLGDVAGPAGLPADRPETAQDRAAITARLDALTGLVAGLPDGRLVVVPGDKDWANGRPDGLRAVRRLEAYLKDHGADVVAPGRGCPGPEVIDVAPTVRLVAVNSAWFTHRFDRPEEPDTDCKTLSAEQFQEDLDDAIGDGRGRRHVLVVGHHPAVSNGTYGGRIPLKRHLFPVDKTAVPLPVLGSIYAAYRQNVGTPRDAAFPGYQAFSKALLGALRDNPGAVYAAAHDYSLQLLPVEGGYQLVSGSLTKHEAVGADRTARFNHNEEGFARLDYFDDGTARVTFLTFERKDATTAGQAFATTLYRTPCAPAPADAPDAPANEAFPCETGGATAAPQLADAPAPGGGPTTVVPGPEYRGGPGKRLFIGPLYRRDWTTPVRVPTLDLATTHGGLRPLGQGGGRQTTSLKLVGADSLEYVFRSVDKDLQGALPPELRNTVVANILRDVTATSQPYSALVCGRLLDATDILHARPALYRLPDDAARLGPYRARFGGLLGTLEDRPRDPERGHEKGFGGSDDISSSFALFRRLYKDNDTHVDAVALTRARCFDMLVADFGKHEDNWRWAGFEQKTDSGKKLIYRPIPRDRDQAFTRWDGLLTWTANREWAVPSIEGFAPHIRGLESLNWPARHLDRVLLAGATREQWQAAARYLQTRLTGAVIDSAADALPPELHTTTGAEYKARLRSRLADLPRAADAYYRKLSRFVDVTGSNKGEVFRVERLAGGDVRVQIFDRQKGTDAPDGPAFYDRTFHRRETKEIRLYGLDGHDRFEVTGRARRSILLRVVGGADDDKVVDDSRVWGLRRLTKVYDTRDTDVARGPEVNDNRSDRPDINRYDRRGFEYDGYTPLFNLLYNQNDGFGVGAGFSYDKQGWRKPDFKSQYGIYGQYTTGGNRQLTAFIRYRHVFGEWDFAGLAEYGDAYPFYNFFGLGNDTRKDETRFADRFYRARFSGPRAEAALERRLLRSKSRFRAGVLYEDFRSELPANSVLAPDNAGQLTREQLKVSTDNQRLAGFRAELDLDFRDRAFFARRGVRFFGRYTGYGQLAVSDPFGGEAPDALRTFSVSEGFAEYYGTARVGLPVTLVVKGGGATVSGNNGSVPFYKFPQLGQNQNLRGYVRNRFTGDAVAYLNTELRVAVGKVQSAVLPFSYGLVGFYDMGRAYVDDRAPGGTRAGYGGGAYIAPLVDRFALSVLYGMSAEESGLIQVAAGFRIDQ